MNEIDIRSSLTETERLQLKKIDKLDTDKKRKRVIIALVSVILILFFVLGTVFGAMHILSYEGTEALPPEEIVYPEIPSSPEKIISSFKKMLDDTKNYNGVKLDVSFDVKLIDESIEITGDKAEAAKPYFDHIKASFINLISSGYESQRYKGKYGEDFSSMLFSTQYLAHSVNVSSSVNEENENDLNYIFDYNEDTLSVPGGGVVFLKTFDYSVDEQVIEAVKAKTASMVKAENVSVNYDDFIMTVNVDRLKCQLNSVQQKRVLDVSLPLTFIGEYEEFGSIDMKFTLELYKTFSFSRVQFFFMDDVCYIEKGSTDEFSYKVISDQSPYEVEVKLKSSDPSVLSVDGSFYKGEKVSADPVTVTATYTYNGIKYEDSCLFYVRIPVEGVKVSDKEIMLGIGDTSVISAAVSPRNATIKDYYWFTSNDSVASVDENGMITANSAGTASVYCITLDGNFRSACSVTVTE